MANHQLTRRQLLAAGVGGTTAALLGGAGRSLAQAAAAVKPAGGDIGAIEHVVFLTLENRSFDHYFGAMSGVRGFDDTTNRAAFTQAWPGGRDPDLLPFHLDSRHAEECTFDLSHTWPAQHASWNNGAMDQFVATHTQVQYEGQAGGVFTMGYYTRADIDFYYALADAFTICDGYHCSVLGPTHPNRLFALSATNDPDGVAGGPVLTTDVASSNRFRVSWPTMPERLSSAGVTWKVYNPAGAVYQPPSPAFFLASDNILGFFKQYNDPTSDLYHRAFHSTIDRDLTHDVRTGQLPAVSWIVPRIGYDEHPPSAPVVGEWFTHKILKILTSNPAVWAKTVLVVNYDENDGFFDHVPPPTPPPGTAGEYLTVPTLPASAGGIRGPIGLGARVPCLVVSPFSRGGYVCHDTFDHTSMLRLLETLFGVTVPNLSAWRRSVTGDLTPTLQAPNNTTVPRLPQTLGFRDPRTSAGCPVSLTPSPVPITQQMPVQESISLHPRVPTAT